MHVEQKKYITNIRDVRSESVLIFTIDVKIISSHVNLVELEMSSLLAWD